MKQFALKYGGNRTYKGLMSKATTPLIDEVKQYELWCRNGLNNLNRVKIVPYLDGGDATVQYLGNMATTTPTLSACNGLYMRYLGRQLTVKRKSSYFDIGEDEQPINQAESKDFVKTIEDLLGGDKGMREFKIAIEKAAKDMLIYGNACIEIIRRSKGKAKGARIRPLEFQHFRYENTENKDELGDWAIRCEDFLRVNYNYEITFQRYAVFPNFSQFEDGTERSICHIKNESENRVWYGLPYSIGAVYSEYLEYQLLKFNSLAFNKKLLPMLAIIKAKPVLTNEATREENKAAMENLEKNYTSNGSADAEDTLGIMPITFNTGEEAPKLVQINPVADSKYFDFISGDNSKKIYSTCGVNEILLEKGGNNLSGGNALYQAALAFYSAQVTDFKEQILPLFNDAIKELFAWFGYNNPSDLVIDLKPPKFLETLATFSEQNNKAAAPTSQAAPIVKDVDESPAKQPQDANNQ